MNIRIANKNDIYNNLLNLYVEGFKMHYEKRKDIFEEKINEDLKDDLVNKLENDAETILVVEEKNTIVGYVAFQYKNKVTKSLWIDEIVIDKNYRNNGYGKELIKELYSYALKNDCKRVELNCWSFNEDALKFYEKIGFTQQRVVLEKEI